MISPQSSILVPGLLTEHPGMSCYRRCWVCTTHDPVDYVPLFAIRERMKPDAVGEVVSYEGLAIGYPSLPRAPSEEIDRK